MPELQMDVAVANRFISSLSKSLQALCHGCMDFDSGIEIVGYINVNIDSGSKVDYVLNEKVLKSTTNSMTFVSNSFLAKKEPQKQIRDGACSPIPHLSAVSSYSSGAHLGSQYHRTSSQASAHSQVTRGAHKRSWTDDWRISPKRHRIQNPQMGMQPFSDQNSQPHPQSFPSSSHVYSDASFKQPQGPASTSDTNNTLQLQINIKKEALETDNQHAADSEHSTFDQSTDDQTLDSSHDDMNKTKIKCDPDADRSDTGETALADGNSAAVNEKTDFKGTFLDPSSPGDTLPSDDRSGHEEDAALPAFDENSETDCTEEQGLTDEANVASVRTANLSDGDAGVSGDNETASDAAVEYDQAGEEGSFSQSAYEDAGEGGSDAGQLEVIEIDDEDEDVQAMFGDTRSAFRKGLGHKDHSHFMVKAVSKHLPVTSTATNAENLAFPAQAGLRHRMDTESGIQCPHCPLVVLDGADYRNHISRQHGYMLQYTCTLCGKGYQTSMGLHYHMQGHEGKNYSCPMCDVKLTRMFSLKMHLKKVHRSAKCQTCHQFLSLGEEFNSHVLHCGNS